MRDVFGISASAVIGLATLMFQPFTHSWYWVITIAAVTFLLSTGHILFATRPLLSFKTLKLYKSKFPIEDAARLAYEKAERADALYMVDSPTLPAENKLNHFKFAFIINDEITLYGIKRPSTALLPIPRQELSELYPVCGLSQLNYKTPFQKLAYADVVISRKDLRRIIRQYIAQVRHTVAQLKARSALS